MPAARSVRDSSQASSVASIVTGRVDVAGGGRRLGVRGAGRHDEGGRRAGRAGSPSGQGCAWGVLSGWCSAQALAVVVAGRRGGDRGGCRRRRTAEEQRHHHGDVRDPDDRLEPGGGGREVEDPLEQRAVPARRRDLGGDVERQGVQAGQEPRLLQVVDAVGQHAGGHDDERGAGPGEERRQVDPQRAAVEQVAEHHREREADRGADQRHPAAAGGLRGGPQDHGGLQALAADREEGGAGHGPGADRQGGVEASAQLARDRAGGLLHPQDHPGDEGDGDDRQRPAEQLLLLERHVPRGEGDHGPEADADGDGGDDAGPDVPELVAAAALDEVRHEDADDDARPRGPRAGRSAGCRALAVPFRAVAAVRARAAEPRLAYPQRDERGGGPVGGLSPRERAAARTRPPADRRPARPATAGAPASASAAPIPSAETSCGGRQHSRRSRSGVSRFSTGIRCCSASAVIASRQRVSRAAASGSRSFQARGGGGPSPGRALRGQVAVGQRGARARSRRASGAPGGGWTGRRTPAAR